MSLPKKWFCMYQLAFLVLISFCQAESSDEAPLSERNNRFAANTYRELKNSSDNLIFSPFSIYSALGMTYQGARGETAEEMSKVLDLAGLENLDLAYKNWRQQLDQNQGGYELKSANAIWMHLKYAVQSEYVSRLGPYYGASWRPVDFLKFHEQAMVQINDWVSRETNGKISYILEKDSLSKQTRMVLINALYFKGRWGDPFSGKETKDAPFWCAPGQSVTVPMLRKESEFKYVERDGVRILNIPYAGDRASMVIFLPSKASEWMSFERSLSPQNLKAWMADVWTAREQTITVCLPRFRFSKGFELSEVLSALGIKRAFSGRADFSGISPGRDLYLDKVFHKVFVEVNEEGVEAAAATAEVMKMLSAEPESAQIFNADHPFVFVIKENTTNTILFMGRVTNPLK